LTFVLVALTATVACSRQRSPQPAANGLTQDDSLKLQGTWRLESSIWNGVPDPPAAYTVTIIFEGDKFIVVDRDGNRQVERIKLMPDQSPKAIDCWSKGGGQPAPGIYKLEGDQLTWCTAGGSNKVRPTSFDSKPGAKQSLMVLRREKR